MPAGAATSEVTAPAGRDQAALTVRIEGDKIEAWACTRPPCEATGAGAWALDVSEPLRSFGERAAPRVEVLTLGQGRHAVHVRWGEEPSYHLVLAGSVPAKGVPAKGVPAKGATAKGQSAKEPEVLLVHQGWSDRWTGLQGERSTSHVEVATSGAVQQVVVGQLREDLTLCGRPALVAPSVLDPVSLTLKPARLQRLSARERKAATHLVAKPVEEATAGAMNLSAVAASSAVGKPSYISDGDLETTWAEGGGGAGRGEFIVMRAPSEVPIRGFEFVSRPPSGGLSDAAGPRSFWLAGDDQLVRVDVPEDPWATPGARFRVELEEPWHTRCVAWVAEEAHGRGADVQVTVAELVALPEGGSATPEELIEWIVAGGDRVAQGVALLASRPAEAGLAVTRALPVASESGRRSLLDVSDRLACMESAPHYALALTFGDRELRERASHGLRRCPAEGTDAVVAVLKGASPSSEARLAQELALLAPPMAVEKLAVHLAAPSPARRLSLRQAIAQAVRDPRAEDAVRQVLTDPALPERAQVDFLRALGERITQFEPEASKVLGRWLEKPSFSTRYLLLGPAVRLASQNRRAAGFVAYSLTKDRSAAVRASAATMVGEVLAANEAAPTTRVPFETELLAALADENVRVREAAARTLGFFASQKARRSLTGLLSDDPWPLARQSAVDALGRLAPDPKLDELLGRTLTEDESPHVRVSAARALGRRGSATSEPWLRRAFADKEQAPAVRQEAARALGAVCAKNATSELVEAALRLNNPHLDAEERRVSISALRALGQLRPPGLAQQLKPLLEGKVPRQVRSLAEEAVAPEGSGSCGPRKTVAFRGPHLP